MESDKTFIVYSAKQPIIRGDEKALVYGIPQEYILEPIAPLQTTYHEYSLTLLNLKGVTSSKPRKGYYNSYNINVGTLY